MNQFYPKQTTWLFKQNIFSLIQHNFFFGGNYNILLTTQFKPFPALDPRVLNTWKGANLTTKPSANST